MASRPNRDKALGESTSDIGKLMTRARSRAGGASKKTPRRPRVEEVTYSFDLGDIRALQIFLLSTGPVIGPPRPKLHWAVRLTLEVPVERPQR